MDHADFSFCPHPRHYLDGSRLFASPSKSFAQSAETISFLSVQHCLAYGGLSIFILFHGLVSRRDEVVALASHEQTKPRRGES